MGVLFQELMEFLFCYVQLLENFVEKPASDLAIAMHWNCGSSAVWMLPSGVAAFLPHHLKSELPGRLLQIPSFGRHEWLTHQHQQGACVLLLRTLPGSSRKRLLARPVPPQESGPRRGSPELQARRPRMYHCLRGEELPCSHRGVSSGITSSLFAYNTTQW